MNIRRRAVYTARRLIFCAASSLETERCSARSQEFHHIGRSGKPGLFTRSASVMPLQEGLGPLVLPGQLFLGIFQ